MSNIEINTSTIHLNNMEMSYRYCGSGPNLILLHGGLMTAKLQWEDFLTTLGETYTVYAPDTRGHGKSTNPDGLWTCKQLVDDLNAFIHQLGLENVFVCGWSDGADTALGHAIRYPGVAQRYILGGVTNNNAKGVLAAMNKAGFKDTGEVDLEVLRKFDPELINMLKQAHSPQGEDYWEVVAAGVGRIFANANCYKNHELNGITAKVLVVLGDRDEYIPVEDAVKLYRAIPNAYLAIVPDGDHALTRTKKDWFLSQLRWFLG